MNANTEHAETAPAPPHSPTAPRNIALQPTTPQPKPRNSTPRDSHPTLTGPAKGIPSHVESRVCSAPPQSFTALKPSRSTHLRGDAVGQVRHHGEAVPKLLSRNSRGSARGKPRSQARTMTSNIPGPAPFLFCHERPLSSGRSKVGPTFGVRTHLVLGPCCSNNSSMLRPGSCHHIHGRKTRPRLFTKERLQRKGPA